MTRAADEGIDADEMRMLRGFFRDEAQEALEQVASTLLSLTAACPDEGILDRLMRTTHTLKGSAGTVGLPRIAEAAHLLEDRLARVRSGSLAWSAEVRDRFVEAVDGFRALLDGIDGTTPAQVAAVMAQIEAVAAPAPVPPPPRHDARTGEPRRLLADRRGGDVQVLRVDVNRIDELMDSVGELGFDRTRITRRARELRRIAGELVRANRRMRDAIRGAPGPGGDRVADIDEIAAALDERVGAATAAATELLKDAEALRRTGNAIQDGLTRMRMLSVQTLFRQLAPQLRAVARSAGKRVELVTRGGDTEFDKTVASQITDPLIQLLRNAVAHGIESPEARADAGKPEIGTVTISARHEGSSVVLEVSDDGAGIDPASLRERFVSSGRWSRAHAELAGDEEVLQAIFEPGMSSRQRADQLAGRGVGLDSVRATVARLGGEIRMRSTVGVGTSFAIRLPITAALTEALLFKVGGDVYAIPNVHVVETAHVEVSSEALPSHLRVRRGAVPLVCLQRVLDAALPADARRVRAVVLEYAGRRLAVSCDKIVGPRAIVVKKLGALLSPLPLYAGGTVSGSGKVQLILDPAALARLAYPETAAAPLPGAPPPVAAGSSSPAPAGAAPQDTLADSGRCALVVDDSPTVRRAVAGILTRAGYQVDVAMDGRLAWTMLCRRRYDALVTDLDMPALDGFGLLERLRASAAHADLPVVVISANATGESRARATALGVAALLEKPIAGARLVAALGSGR